MLLRCHTICLMARRIFARRPPQARSNSGVIVDSVNIGLLRRKFAKYLANLKRIDSLSPPNLFKNAFLKRLGGDKLSMCLLSKTQTEHIMCHRVVYLQLIY